MWGCSMGMGMWVREPAPVGVTQAQPLPVGLLVLGSGLWVQRCTVHFFSFLLSDVFNFQFCLGFTGLLEDD